MSQRSNPILGKVYDDKNWMNKYFVKTGNGNFGDIVLERRYQIPNEKYEKLWSEICYSYSKDAPHSLGEVPRDTPAIFFSIKIDYSVVPDEFIPRVFIRDVAYHLQRVLLNLLTIQKDKLVVVAIEGVPDAEKNPDGKSAVLNIHCPLIAMRIDDQIEKILPELEKNLNMG